MGLWDDEPADPKLAHFDGLDGIVSTAGQVFLGLSINCARCHDHKKDPLPHGDYYRFLAFFSDVTNQDGRNTRRIGPEPGLENGLKRASVALVFQLAAIDWRFMCFRIGSHTSHSVTAWRRLSIGSRVGMNSWPTWPW